MVYGVISPEASDLDHGATCACSYSAKSSFSVYLVGHGVRVVPILALTEASPKCTICTLGCSEICIGIR